MTARGNPPGSDPFVGDAKTAMSGGKDADAFVTDRPQFHQPLGAPRRTLGNFDVLALTVGIVIGAGIFRTPALVAGVAGSAEMLIAVWVAGGLLSIIGALCYAELAAAFPNVGGDYHFLGRAYGERLAFLYAWARLSVIQTGSLALLAYVCGDYLQAILPLGAMGSTIWAALAVILISALNRAGVREGAAAQRWLTIAEVAGLVLLIVAGFLVSPAEARPAPVTDDSALGLMLVFVLLTYGGWSEAVYVSAEMKDAPRRMAPIMAAGLALVTLLYVLANLSFLNALGLAGMAESDAVAAEVARLALGDGGAAVIALAVAIAALTSANATAITGARTTCAIGRRFPALSWLGRWDEQRDTPGNAMIAQAAVALVLVLAGAFARDGFRLIVEYTAPVFWFFLLLTGLALFVLRRRMPDLERPYRVPCYPLLPAVFCATTAYLLYSSVAYTGWGALAGIGVLAVGGMFLLFLTPVPDEAMETLP
ncbi:amino acid permease [Sphingomonas sp. S1-29]|uniref:APC family permease n=1 Tax=Sphingomonas sp. S1-29 TaxID=2991074 RepID=UPI0022401B3E|nr:amino acid permease [Sphingomonas sp. S1-29]UZK70818.1 amino acid permease [Sphingomonas sp. S1-29]